MLFGNSKNSQVTVFSSLPEFDATVTYCSDYFLIKTQGFCYTDLELGTEIEDNT